MDLSFVIPCYNEEGNVQAIYRSIRETMRECSFSYEIILVNDGSKDQTRQKLKELYEETADPHLIIVNFSRNFGKEAAILAGMRHSTGNAVCFMDADLQQLPSVALSMYRKLLENEAYDAVCAYQKTRIEKKSMSFLKRLFYRLINRICDVGFVSDASDFRVCRRSMIQAIMALPEYYRFSKGIFSWVGFETLYIPYEANERLSGTTKWSFKKLLQYGIDGIIGYTTMPLRLATHIGSLLSVIAFIYMIVLIVKTLIIGVEVPGYATTLGFVLLIGGIQLLILGIIGEYLARTYIQGKNRPIYIEKDVWETKDGK